MKRMFLLLVIVASSHSYYDSINKNELHNYNNNTNDVKIFLSNLISFPEGFFDKGIQHISTYKYRYLLALCVASYGSLTGHLVYTRHIMGDQKRWNNFYGNISFKKLAQIPQEEMYKALQQEIERRYDTPTATIMMDLNRFLKETGHEINLLERYASIGSWLCTLKINLIFFVTSTSVKEAHEKAKKLTYFRTVIAQKVEPKNVVRRLTLINAYRKLQSLMRRALDRRR